jgi:hypothetical protein
MTLTEGNYYSREADMRYLSVSQYKNFCGTYGMPGCEFQAMEKLAGRWVEPSNTAMLIGSYVDAWMDGPEEFENFRGSHPDMFRADGTLKATYAAGDRVIQRVSRDHYWMARIQGEHQVIMTGELFGTEWKIKMDSYFPHAQIVDLKVVKSLRERKWVSDLGEYLCFIDYWGYDVQGAIYQEIVRQNTGEKLPFYIIAADKGEHVDHDYFLVPQARLDEALYKVEAHMDRLLRVKRGEEPPDRCETCGCCLETKMINRPKLMDEI